MSDSEVFKCSECEFAWGHQLPPAWGNKYPGKYCYTCERPKMNSNNCIAFTGKTSPRDCPLKSINAKGGE